MSEVYSLTYNRATTVQQKHHKTHHKTQKNTTHPPKKNQKNKNLTNKHTQIIAMRNIQISQKKKT